MSECARKLHARAFMVGWQAGIACPTPLLLRMHVLVMTFLGKDGYNAPRLKDADLSEEKARPCRLVQHGNMRRVP